MPRKSHYQVMPENDLDIPGWLRSIEVLAGVGSGGRIVAGHDALSSAGVRVTAALWLISSAAR
jgi:hypothetical protein